MMSLVIHCLIFVFLFLTFLFFFLFILDPLQSSNDGKKDEKQQKIENTFVR